MPALALRVLLRLILPALIGGVFGLLLTLPQALVAGACLLGLWACWKFARP